MSNTKLNDINTTLTERGKNYGDFSGHALFTQMFKTVMESDWESLDWLLNEAKKAKLESTSRTASQHEALEMIAHKIGRILNGNADYADSWHDIAGYATLVENQINNKDKTNTSITESAGKLSESAKQYWGDIAESPESVCETVRMDAITKARHEAGNHSTVGRRVTISKSGDFVVHLGKTQIKLKHGTDLGAWLDRLISYTNRIDEQL